MLKNEIVSSFCFESIPSFAKRLDTILDECIKNVGNVASVAILLCGLFALFYIGNMVWQGWCKGESINVYALFRPFAIGLIIINFSTFVQVMDTVCGWINKPTEILVEKYSQDGNDALEKKLKKYFDSMIEGETKAKEGDIKLNVKKEGESTDVSFSMDSKESSSSWSLTGSIADAIKENIMREVLALLSIVSLVVAIGVLTIAFVSKLILVYVGPFAFALSLIPYFSGSLPNWIGRYVTVSLYAPCVNITCFAMMKLFRETVESIGTSGEIGLGYYLILSLASTASFLAIPSISNYIVSSAGAGGLTGEGRRLASLAGGKALVASKLLSKVKR
ncbi:MAG: hypothetical protein K6F48_12860 [Paludibacteraceae bacterium]|nr:hypothetical protein [Paludibacteraceae bacterium]